MPLPNILEFIGTNVTQAGFKVAQQKLLDYLGIEVPTKTDLSSAISNVNSAITPKADKTYVDTALAGFTNGAIKAYPTLALANADIANIALDTKVSVLSATEGGDYYKATAGATSLTKSPYDSYEKAKSEIAERVKYSDGVQVQEGESPSISTQNGVELLGFDRKGRLIALLSPYILNQINKNFDLSKLKLDLDASLVKTNLLKMQASAQFPAICSNNGDVELLGFDEKGHAYFQPSKTLINKFKAGLDLQSYFNNFDYTSIGLLPNKNIVMWGDSMTQNGTSSKLAELMTDRAVIGRGIGGQNSKQIAIRAGAIPMMVTLADNTIPASGGVAVTNSNAFGILTQGGSSYGTVIVKIAGVRGTITTNSAGAWTFTRSIAGDAVTTVENEIAVIDGDTAFVPNPEQYRNHTVIIWAGRNWSWGGRAEIVQVRDEILAIVKHLTSKNKRYLVISPCNANGEGIGTERYQLMNDLNAELKSTFGDRYVNIRDSIVKHSLADLGITPTAQDLIDIENDIPPSSIRSDGVHFTAQGYEYTAKLLQRQILARGW